MTLIENITDRGLKVIEFTDRNGNECKLMESSLAYPAAIRIGIKNHMMHLSTDELKILLPLLNNFLENEQL